MENKLDLQQFILFTETFFRSLNRHPEWRLGQTVFNSLYIVDPEAGNYVRGTDLDPFYKDERVGATIKALFTQEACESAEAISFFNYIYIRLLEKEVKEKVDIFLFSKEHRIEVVLGSDLQYQCYIDFPKYQAPFSIGLDFYSALIEGIHKFLLLKIVQDEA